MKWCTKVGRRLSIGCWLLVAAWPARATVSQEPVLRLTVHVVAKPAAPRTVGLLDAVRAAGLLPRLVDRADCAPEALRTADVVLVDWPAEEALGERAPLGPLERWDRPTVFVGEAGDLFARSWGLPTAAEMAAMPAATRGPEMDELARPDTAAAVVWRQGHLFHFAAPAGPAALTAVQHERLLQVVRSAARFVSDRPIVRHAVPAGVALPATEVARRERIDAACRRFDVQPDAAGVLARLIDRLGGQDSAEIAALLVELAPDSCTVQTSKTNWMNWLSPRSHQLVWDPLSRVWRLDLLAFWRGVSSEGHRGDARADGAVREPAAVALATKVVQHHGGRALADLATFSCWQGSVCLMWDRRHGYFRMENHAEPGRRATPWTVAVIDTAADSEVIWGGGPPPRPRVSARGAFRELVEHAFLPAMLLDPGVSLRRLAAEDADGLQAIAVQLTGRGMDARAEHVLFVDPATGAIRRRQRLVGSQVQREQRAVGSEACGPLSLPTSWCDDRNERTYLVEEPTWNAELPAGLATAPERLSKVRDR
jgi:hypothetical protein